MLQHRKSNAETQNKLSKNTFVLRTVLTLASKYVRPICFQKIHFLGNCFKEAWNTNCNVSICIVFKRNICGHLVFSYRVFPFPYLKQISHKCNYWDGRTEGLLGPQQTHPTASVSYWSIVSLSSSDWAGDLGVFVFLLLREGLIGKWMVYLSSDGDYKKA